MLRGHDRKSLDCFEQSASWNKNLNIPSGENSEEVTNRLRKTYDIIENIYIIMNIIFIEMWTLKSLLVESQKELRNMLLEIGEKGTFISWWQEI